jgi:archaeosine-15-forming tRNA-guanine transglycosylase
MSKPRRYYHVDALQLLDRRGKNVFAYYNPKADERLRPDDEAFEKRKI